MCGLGVGESEFSLVPAPRGFIFFLIFFETPPLPGDKLLGGTKEGGKIKNKKSPPAPLVQSGDFACADKKKRKKKLSIFRLSRVAGWLGGWLAGWVAGWLKKKVRE
jgi:hypothetical protein